MKQILLDVETGSLDPVTGAITELAAVVFEEREGKLVELDHFHALVRPHPDCRVEEGAAKVQGKTVEEIYAREGMLREADAFNLFGLFLFAHELRACDCWAHYSQFDNGFLHHMEIRTIGHNKSLDPWFSYQNRMQCSKNLASMLRASKKINPDSCKLDSLLSYFDFVDELAKREQDGHNALDDCRLTLLVLEQLQKKAGML